MKKSVTLALLFAGAFTSAAYAQGNLFTPADCDSNGWLWFDTQEKIDKYVGDMNSDKILKMVPTKYQEEVEPDIFENLYNTVSPTIYGVGTDGNLPGEDPSTGAAVGTDAKQGAIALAPAKGHGQQNGGGILMHLPSCYYCEVFLSAETRITPCLYAGLGHKETIDLGIVKGFAAPFLILSKAGQTTWKLHEQINENNGLTIKQEGDVTVYLINDNSSKAELFVHGMKVQVYGEGAGIAGTQADSDHINIAQTGRFISLSREADVTVYNAGGKEVLSARAEALDLGALGTGLYIVQARDNNAVSTQKVLIP